MTGEHYSKQVYAMHNSDVQTDAAPRLDAVGGVPYTGHLFDVDTAGKPHRRYTLVRYAILAMGDDDG